MEAIKKVFSKAAGSLRFQSTLAGVIVVIANQYFGLNWSAETVLGIVAMIITFIAGRSATTAIGSLKEILAK